MGGGNLSLFFQGAFTARAKYLKEVKFHEEVISFVYRIVFFWGGLVFYPYTKPAHAFFFWTHKKCKVALKFCDAVNQACGGDECTQTFPGDGYGNPDSFGVSGHGPALSYTDNGDLTATDDNTKFMWEVKLAADGSNGGNCNDDDQEKRSVHCVNNTYTWSASASDDDGTLFTDFLDKLNNRCDGNESMSCNIDADCGANGPCGFAGHRDWFIPNVKQLQSIVDYGTFSPAIDSTFPGATASSFYWSATTSANDSDSAWFVNFNSGLVGSGNKIPGNHARGVRLCP